MTNVAILGSGKRMMQHYVAWSHIDDVQLVGYVDTAEQNLDVPERVKDIQFASLEELAQTHADLVDICVPLEDRAASVKQAAEMGLHVICDMPVAETLEETADVLKVCKAHNVRLFPGGSLRFTPAYADAHQRAADGAMGQAGMNRLARGAAHPGEDTDMFTGLGLPELDWLLWTFGDVDHVVAKHVKTENKAARPVEYAAITLRMTDGSMAHLELSWAQSKNSSFFELTGDKGMLTYDSEASQPITVDTVKPLSDAQSSDEVLASTVLERQLTHFAENWRGGEPEITEKALLKAMQVAAAARASAAAGKPVDVERGRSV